MDIGSLLLGLALLVVIGFLVARPLMERPDVSDEPLRPAELLLGERERVLTQLRDLDFDRAMSKINEVDYSAQRAQLVAEGVAILKQIDASGINTAGGTAEPAGADAIEAAVARRRAPGAMPLPAAAPADEIEAAVAQLRGRRAASKPATAASSAVAAATGPAPAKPKPTIAPRDLDAEIEAGVAQRRLASANQPASSKVSAGASLARLDKPASGEPPPNADEAAAAEPAAGDEKLACGQCGSAVLSSDRFCPKCGSPLMVTCGHCGRVARAGDQFCGQCGQPLPAAVAAGQPVRPAKAQT